METCTIEPRTESFKTFPTYTSHQKMHIIIDMRYDKNGLPANEYYTEELIKPTIDKKKALENQKYYIGASILLLFIALTSMLCSISN